MTVPIDTVPIDTVPIDTVPIDTGPIDTGPIDRSPPRRWYRPTDVVHDAGMATAEYAIATLAACGFAGLLVALLRSGEVRGLLLGIVRRALSVG